MPSHDEREPGEARSEPPPSRSDQDASDATARRPPGKRITWDDFDSRTRSLAVHEVMRRCHMPRRRAEELVTDAMIRLVRLEAVARHPRRLLIHTAIRELQSEWRRQSTHVRRLVGDDAHVPHIETLGSRAKFDDAGEVGDRVANDEASRIRMSRLRTAIDRLPEPDRRLIQALYFDERSLADIAEEHDCTRVAVKTRLWRARERLRDALVCARNPQERAR